MKPLSSLVVRLALVAVFSLTWAGGSEAQQVTILQNLGSDFFAPNNTAGLPEVQPGVIQGSDGFFYGLTAGTGSAGIGNSVFKISPQGDITSNATNFSSQGAPVEGTDYNFYITSFNSNGGGTIYQVSAQGQLNTLYTFPVLMGVNFGNPSLGTPLAGLIQATDGNFYGTTSGYAGYNPYAYYFGGSPFYYAGSGIAYKITPQGQLTVLHTFGDGSVTNDGANSQSALVQGSDGNFYGTTTNGGSGSMSKSSNTAVSGAGTVFKMTPQGTVTILHSFNDGSVLNDGQEPDSALIQGTDGNFYGTTTSGGGASEGCIYKITPQGQVTILHSFADGSAPSDGTEPLGGLLKAIDGNFYGTTQFGGKAGGGVIYELTPQAKYTILHHFNDGTVQNDGALCQSSLIQGSDGNLYGTTAEGPVQPGFIEPVFQGTAFKVILNYPALTSATQVSGNVGVPLKYKVVASNATTSITSTTLPDGLSLDPATGLITGTPTSQGFTTVTLTLTNAFGSNTAPLNFNIGALPVPVVTSQLTAYGATGTPFSYTVTASPSATSFTVSGLPTNLTYDSSSGIISGTPTVSGTFAISITASNGSGSSTAVTLSLQITASAPTLSQEYVQLYQFNNANVTGDGQNPNLIFQGFDGSLFGATQAGGSESGGTVFNLTTQGSTTSLVSLGASSSNSSTVDRTAIGLVQSSDGNFYGTAQNLGGTMGGYFFQITPQQEVTILHHFGDGSVANDGQSPMPGLVQGLDGNFYGTTEFGGSAGLGCVYRVTPLGDVTILHSFGDGSVTNDGQYPTSGLIQAADGTFYGMTFAGGSQTTNAGTIYKVTLLGQTGQTAQVTILHSFLDGSVPDDGGQPATSLLLGDDGNFYGTTPVGGSFEIGCAFKMTPAGAVTILHSFGDGSVTNDGESPQSPLIEGFDGNFYSTTSLGGSASQGTIYTMTKAGSVTILHNFGDGSVATDGSYPTSLCQGLDGNFYGVTQSGGFGNGFGTVFAILAGQQPVHAPVFAGSAFASSAVNVPFTFTPKAAFGASGTGFTASTVAANSLQPAAIGKSFGRTNWILTQGNTANTMLPNDLSFDSTSGTISGTPIVSGQFTITMTPVNAIGTGTAQTITLYIDVPPIITSPGTAGGNMLTLFNYSITADAVPFSFGATDLPGWLSVNTATGQLAGTPPTGGTFVFNAVAENYAGTSSQPVLLTVTGGVAGAPAITSPTTVNGSAGTPVNYQITATLSPTAYTALILPVGLTCDPKSGLISGTPTTAGTYSVPITATNGAGSTASEVTFNIAPAGSPVIAGPLTAQVYQNQSFTYHIPASGLVSVYSVIGLPGNLAFDPLAGVISGTLSNVSTIPLQVIATNGSGSSTSALSLSVVVPTPQSYGDWASQNGASGGETAAPDKDGVPNLLKYLYDIDPARPVDATDASSALPTLGEDTTSTPNTTYLTLTYRQYELATGLTIGLESSTDLKTWTPVTAAINQQVGNDPTTGDPIREMGVVYNGSKLFIRLNVMSSQ